VLRLRHLQPGSVACFLFFEATVALAAILALAGWVNWGAVIVLPAAVAAMVKLNDFVAGRLRAVSGGAADNAPAPERAAGD
jgi:hypothetical protein